jgi:transposase
MQQFNYFLGIDVSKDKIDWKLIDTNFEVLDKGITENNSKSITSFARKLLKSRELEAAQVLVCLEHTGLYSMPTCSALYELGLPVWLENPTRIKSSRTLDRGKSDEIDALKIAQYAVRYYNPDLKIWTPPSEDLLRLRELLAERERLMNCKSTLTVPMQENKQMENKVGYMVQEAYSTPAIELFNKLIKEVEQELGKLVNDSESFKDTAKIIRSVPGAGPILTATLIKETDNFTRFTPKDYKQLACHAGVVPFEHSSGSSVRGRPRLSRKANKGLKSILHMSAMTAKKYIPEFAAFFARQKAKGKATLSVLNALRNRMLKLIMTLLEKGVMYDPNWGKGEKELQLMGSEA